MTDARYPGFYLSICLSIYQITSLFIYSFVCLLYTGAVLSLGVLSKVRHLNRWLRLQMYSMYSYFTTIDVQRSKQRLKLMINRYSLRTGILTDATRTIVVINDTYWFKWYRCCCSVWLSSERDKNNEFFVILRLKETEGQLVTQVVFMAVFLTIWRLVECICLVKCYIMIIIIMSVMVTSSRVRPNNVIWNVVVVDVVVIMY